MNTTKLYLNKYTNVFLAYEVHVDVARDVSRSLKLLSSMFSQDRVFEILLTT